MRSRLRALLPPLVGSALCFMAALALIGPELAFGGYLMALLAGGLAASALIGGVRRVEPRSLSMAAHVALGGLWACCCTCLRPRTACAPRCHRT